MLFHNNLLMVINLMIIKVYGDSETWVKVMVDKIYFENEISNSFMVHSKFACGSICIIRSNDCNIWCYPNHKKCFLSSTIVSPSYVETSQDFYVCYTRKRRDIVVGSITYSSPTSSYETENKLAADGIYSQNNNNRFFITLHTDHPWILFDLKEYAKIYEIIIKIPDCNKIIIKIGDNLVEDGNFISYRQLNSVFDLCNYDDEYLHFKPAKPMEGRYVVVIRSSSHVVLWFYHIEIDGEF